MLISHYSHLMKEEGVSFRNAIVQGSMERLSPILMTALLLGVGLIPLALGVGEPGKEIQQPMAVVILGGIFTSTFLNMIVMRLMRAATMRLLAAFLGFVVSYSLWLRRSNVSKAVDHFFEYYQD